MPIFEFVCKECGHEFECLRKSASEKADCEKCGSKKTARKLSAFATASSDSTCEKMPSCPAAVRGACGSGCGRAWRDS